jgi:hypothetical protein
MMCLYYYNKNVSRIRKKTFYLQYIIELLNDLKQTKSKIIIKNEYLKYLKNQPNGAVVKTTGC